MFTVADPGYQKRGGCKIIKIKGGGGGTPPAQLGGLGERCKLPQRGLEKEPQPPTLFNYIMVKTLHKTACVQKRKLHHSAIYEYKNC